MNMSRLSGRLAWLAITLTSLPGLCGEKQQDKQQQPQTTQSTPESIELFAAIQGGKISVALVPQSYSALNLRVRNNTRQALKVELPSTIAAVPTARLQARQGATGPTSLSNGFQFGQNQGGSQGLGGSLGGPWAGGTLAQVKDKAGKSQPVNSGPRYWTLAPRQVFQTQIPCFCLEFGKPDPNSRIPYQLCPLDQLNNRPAVKELIDQFAQQRIAQSVAQLAAWHIANDVPWQLLTRVQFPRTPNSRGHHVTPMELVAARKLAESLPSYGQPSSLAGRSGIREK